ncbi:MAG TPA: serine hydrolase [Candidatus Elarobacter sp.]|nr:serine hydrolase [Candidatus Elarobacter sp.]
MTRAVCLSLALALTLLPAAPSTAAPAFQAVLDARAAAAPGLGIIAGVVDHGGTQIAKAGSTGNAVPLDEHTVFEIGSVTKTFTATILASMVRDGTVRLDDPVAKYLPSSVHVPSRNGKTITLLNLATQHSGLPRQPTNLDTTALDPYAHYGTKELYAFLDGYTLTRDPGAEYEYSNLGVGLLGVALANAAHTTYPELLRRRILAPLGMNETSVATTGSTRPRFAAPHTTEGEPARNWTFDALAPAGGITSTVADMLKYVRCNLGEGPLGQTCLFAQQPRDAGLSNQRIGLVWYTGDGGRIVHHNGATPGYNAAVAVSSDHTRGAVVLANGGLDVDDVARNAIDPSVQVVQADPLERNDPALLDTYVGTYVNAGGTPFLITRRAGQLFARLGTQNGARVAAAGRDRFLFRAVGAQLDFTHDAQGRVNALVLNQNGNTTVFVRPGMTPPTTIPTAAPSIAASSSFPPVIPLDAATLDAYAGIYVLNDATSFTVRRAGDVLEVQLTGQQFNPVYPSAKDRFFYKVVDAQIEFTRDASGAVTGLVLHQDGRATPARRR